MTDRTPRVLIVEDSPTQSTALALLLQEHGYDTAVAASGAGALELVRSEPFDLVLSDVVMPGMDGYELCRRVKTELGRADLPVVLLTSLTDPLDIVRGLESGADHYITKPYDPERLLARVRHVLRHSRELAATPGQPVTVTLLGSPFTIAAAKEQILDLLVSSYGDLVHASEAVREGERRARFLAEAGELFSSTLDRERVLRDLVRLAVQAVADLAAVETLDERGAFRVVEVAHVDPACAELAAALRAGRAAGGGGGGGGGGTPLSARVAGARRAELVREVTAASVAEIAPDEAHARALREAGVRSWAAIPLVAHARTLGVLLLATCGSRRALTEDDLAFAEELARRAAIAADNARLYHEARQATRERDDVLAIVSHDLRNPLHTIYMATAFLLDLVRQPIDPAQLEAQLGVIKRAASRGNTLIQDLLDVSRIEAGRLTIDASPVSAPALLEDAVNEMTPLAREKSLALSHEWVGAPALVNADRGRIGQLFSNVIGNAIKFTPAGGRIVVRGEVRDGAAAFSISDTGPGILPEQLPHLFDRFWQAKQGSRAGAGLGLFIAKGIAEAHGGRLRVESAPGDGTTFTFTLPVAPGGAPPAATAASRPPPAGG
jgi:signal transduction histidine kinase